MARTVREIMNHELFAVRPEEKTGSTLASIIEWGVTAAPVLDEERRPIGVVSLRDLVNEDKRARRMTSPAVTIPESATISDAGRVLAAADVHHVVVVDAAGRATGMVSALDIVRGLLGIPVRHPAAFPHRDGRFGVSWSDDRELAAEGTGAVPDAAGVLVLTEGGAGRGESMLWVESCTNLRARADEMVNIPPLDDPLLSRILARKDLRFRYAVVSETDRRQAIADELREALSHLPWPQSSIVSSDVP